MKQITFTHVIIGIIVVAVGAIVLVRSGVIDTGPSKYDAFAQCLGEKGAKFYGAFWCPHCAAQKAMFGKSVKLLPYVECSAPDGKTQLPVCTDMGVESYPTWVFADGSRLSGEQELQVLADKTSCTLPADA